MPDTFRPTNDHDLLIQMNASLREVQESIRELAQSMRDLRTAQEATSERQRDQDNRLTNVTSTVVRMQADQRDFNVDVAKLRESHDKRISDIDDLLDRWKIYLRVMVLLGTPVYLAILALAIEAAKRYLFP